MQWQLRSDQPIYSQLMQQLSKAIIKGEFSSGKRLPSVRDLAMEAGVNPNTMQRALSDLEREGLVYSQRTAGRFVTDDNEVIKAAKLRLADERIKSFLSDMTQLGCTKEEIIAIINDL